MPNIQARVCLFSSNCAMVVPGAAINAIPELIYVKLSITVLGGKTSLAFSEAQKDVLLGGLSFFQGAPLIFRLVWPL